MNIIESQFLFDTEQVKFLRCNKKKWKRVKKFKKNINNFSKVPMQKVFMFDGNIICHPSIADEVRKRYGDKNYGM